MCNGGDSIWGSRLLTELWKGRAEGKVPMTGFTSMHSVVMVSSTYPTVWRKLGQTYFQSLARELHRQGHDVTVIAPEPVVSVSERRVNFRFHEFDDDGVHVMQPLFLSYPRFRLGDAFTSHELTTDSFSRSVLSCVPRLAVRKTLACYGHFFYPCGYAVARLAEKLKCVSVAGFGGSVHGAREVIPIPLHRRRRDIQRFDAILSVSKSIRDFYLRHYDISQDKFRVFQNAADIPVFYPRNKHKMRSKLGLPQHDFIVIFVGRFEPKKGSERLLAAVRKVPEAKVIFLGRGKEDLSSSQTLFAGLVPYDMVPEFLSAADVFALPTLFEGSCNAIQEALACGLPVVSANRDFNIEIIDDSVGLLVDAEDVNSIAAALRTLYEKP